MAERFREKLGDYLNDELEELKYLSSINNSRVGSRSPRYLNHSPRPNRVDRSPINTQMSTTSQQQQQHDSRPSIAAWPTPIAAENVLTVKPRLKTSSATAQPQQQPPPLPPTINTSLCTDTTTSSSLGTRCGGSGGRMSVSPIPNSSTNLSVGGVSSPPYSSPQLSPRIHQQQQQQQQQQNESSHFDQDSSKLLSMLKVVAASSPGPRVGRESELRQKIQTLEETVAEYERQKYNVMGTFSEYRERVAERERKLEAEYSNRIISLSEEVLGAKKDFETRMKSFQSLQEQFEREKEQSLEKLRQEHQKEIQVLERRFSESQLLNLEQKYIIEIQRLEEERKSLRTEKERLGETFEMKLRRAQSLYETELTAAKILYTKELEALRDHEEALKEELSARQDEFHDRLQEIQHQAKQNKDEMNNAKNEVTLLERKLRKKELEIKNISKDLLTARNETNDSIKKLNDAQIDLNELRKEYEIKKAELQRKSTLLIAAETTRDKLESTIRELAVEVKGLKNKVIYLEMERENLQSQSESQTQLHNSQVQALEAVLDSVTKEKETTKEHYEKLLEQEREQAEEREYSIKKEFSTKLNELEDQYNALREHIEQSDSFGPENVKLWEEIECLRSEKSVLEEEVSGLRNQLTNSNNDENKNEASSLDYIIELLRAIDLIKKKVLQPSTTNSSRASLNPEEEKILEKNDFDEKNRVFIDANIEDIRQELNTTTSNIGKPPVELTAIIKKLKELGNSLDEIIVEKNVAQAKVEQLSDENRILMEKLEYFKELNGTTTISLSTTTDSTNLSEILRLNKTLDEYKNKILELEENSKKKLELEQKKMEQNFRDQMNHQREKLQDEIKELNEKLLANEENNIYEKELLKNQLEIIKNEKSSMENELKSKEQEMEKFYIEVNEYYKKREYEQLLALDEKIINLNQEHKKTIELIGQREHELKEKLKKVEISTNKKIEVEENFTQTDLNEPNSILYKKIENENVYLKQKLIDFEEQNKEKNSLIEELQQKLLAQKQELDVYFSASSSDGSTKNDEINKKSSDEAAADAVVEEFSEQVEKSPNENETLIKIKNIQKETESNQNAKKELNIDENNCSSNWDDEIKQLRNEQQSQSIVATTTKQHDSLNEIVVSNEYNQKSRSEKCSLKMKDECIKEQIDPSNGSLCSSSSNSWINPRNKSPGLISSRYRETSPNSKLRFDSISNSNSSGQRSLLTPTEADMRRRISPSRQLIFNKNIPSNIPTTYDKSEKRPAWKF